MIIKNNKLLLSALICSFVCGQASAIESKLWQQFKYAKSVNKEAALPDFSYAGYQYSEAPIPDTSSWTVFDVTKYGAIPNDKKYDDVAIQSAINAAQKAGGGIVLFPAGRFMVSPNETVGENIFITTSNIVIKGQGSGDTGTEIFMDKMKVDNGRYIFEVKALANKRKTATTVIADALRETFKIEVKSTKKLSVGQRIVLKTDSVEMAKDYFAPLVLDKKWTRIHEKGFRLQEIHTIDKIEGNTVYLREPLHISLKVNKDPIKVQPHTMINHVGFEDILFKGNWNNYPEDFEHHKNKTHDYAWNALRIDNLENGWIRNVQFKDWNQGVFISGSAALTLENLLFSGKKGHKSVHVRKSYGVLIKDSKDTASHHHGPGVGYWNSGAVYLRYEMVKGQYIDSHSGTPYATLFDNVINGSFHKSGGPIQSYPHHGKHMTFWNFVVSGSPKKYDFWRAKRNGNTFAAPFFVGLQGKKVTFKKGTYSINELQGKTAEPKSLFEAQLALRLAK